MPELTGGTASRAQRHPRADDPTPAHPKKRTIGEFLTTLARLAKAHRRNPLDILAELTRLRTGPGRLSLDDYQRLGFADRALYPGADRLSFVGVRASIDIWMTVNYQINAFGLVNNKIAADLLFAAHGFRVIPSLALFRPEAGIGGRFHIGSDAQLRAWLADQENYPLFGKPVAGYRSLGSTSLERYDEAAACVVTTAGERVTLDGYIAYAKKHAASGYLFQRRVSPHAALRAICGDRLATVRVLTIVADGTPKAIRACWKIPAGKNAADNFWRPGNLLAQLDLATGRVLRVLRGAGATTEEITHHPDTGAALVGTTVPNWRQIIEMAVDGAKVIGELALAGWDIAPVDDGAVLVELNETPDFQLHQLADGKGLLDRDMTAFLAEKRASRKLLMKQAKAKRRAGG